MKHLSIIIVIIMCLAWLTVAYILCHLPNATELLKFVVFIVSGFVLVITVICVLLHVDAFSKDTRSY